MAKKIYHIPLQKSLLFLQNNKSELRATLLDTHKLEYMKLFGKSYYLLAIEEFIEFFKIDKELKNALEITQYFNSLKFFDEIFILLNFAQFEIEETKRKDFTYAFFFYLHKQDKALFEQLLSQLFLHFHTSHNAHSNINIDYKELSHALTKNRELKESFGEDENGAFFKLLLDGELIAEQRGVKIKTLRKKVYKKAFFTLLDKNENHTKAEDVIL